MSNLPTKVKDRLVAGLKRFQPVLAAAKSRDVNESDTVIIVTDLLAEMFGFDKYSEITSEFVVRGTYVDLAIKFDGAIQLLIEVKAIGLDLKDNYIKQAVDYAANQGVEWVALTNGETWHVYKVNFSKPIAQELVFEINLLATNPKDTDQLSTLYMLTKEGLGKAMLDEYHAQRQALSRYFISAMMITDPVLNVLRRELRQLSPDVKVDNEQIRDVITQEIFKREVIEGEKAEEARKKIARAASRAQRKAAKEAADDEPEPAPADDTPAAPPAQ